MFELLEVEEDLLKGAKSLTLVIFTFTAVPIYPKHTWHSAKSRSIEMAPRTPPSPQVVEPTANREKTVPCPSSSLLASPEPSGSQVLTSSEADHPLQELSDIQRATLNNLRELMPVEKWDEITAGCRDSRAVYDRLHCMCACRQIKGVRLEVRKQEWIAAWTDRDRRERRKYFSIRQRGEERAWGMAVKMRADALNGGARVRWALNRTRSSQPRNRALAF